MDPILREYYDQKKDFINESIRNIIPLSCSDKYLNKIVGHFGPQWNVFTLQKYFFDPVNTYIDELKLYKYGLGVCIFLEGAGITLKSYRSLIGQSEILNISKSMLLHISRSQVPNCDVQTIGNVGVGLLTFPTHAIAEIPALQEEQKYEILSNSTLTAFKSFFGNGLRTYWREHSIRPDIQQYLQFAALVNLPVLNYPINLLLVLEPTILQAGIKGKLQRAAKDLSVAIQLKKDLNAFLEWGSGNDIGPNKKFHSVSNYVSLLLHDKKDKGSQKGIPKSLSIEVIRSAGTIELINDQISKYLARVKEGVSGITPTGHFEHLLHCYIDYIVESQNKGK